jgi:hypothetical protein
MWGYALWQGQETTAYWGQALTWPWAAALVPVFLVACYLLLRWVEKHDLPTVETAMRWFAD